LKHDLDALHDIKANIGVLNQFEYKNDEALLRIQNVIANVGGNYRGLIAANLIDGDPNEKISPFIPEAMILRSSLSKIISKDGSGSQLTPTKLYGLAEQLVKESILINPFEDDNLFHFTIAIILTTLRNFPKDEGKTLVKEILKTQNRSI
jgi:hypothetical protein